MSETSTQPAVTSSINAPPWWAGQIQAWESEVHALLGAVIPGEFIVQAGLPVDGQHLSPENLRATLAHSVGKLVDVLMEERRTHDGQVKTLTADFRHIQDQWHEHTKKVEGERDIARGDRELMSGQLKAIEATSEARRLALQQALDESGCTGDLCAHRWHEAVRTALAPVEPVDGAKTCSLCAKPLTYPLVTIGDGSLVGKPGADGREIARGDMAHDCCYWKARAEKAEGIAKAYKLEARRQWKAPICAWGCEHPTGIEVMGGTPPALDCDEVTLAEAGRQFDEAVKAHALSCPKHPLGIRAEKAEAEVKRVQGLIDRDRTGLAAGLVAVSLVVKGYWWLAEGGWGSHEEQDQNEGMLRQEFAYALEALREICSRHLSQSGDRANAAFHGGSGPAESIDLGSMRLVADAQHDELEVLGENLRRQVKDLAEKHRRAMRLASKTASAPGEELRALISEIADERAALLGMFPNDLVIYAWGGSTSWENARKTLASSLGALLRAFNETKAVANGLQQGMTLINDALDEFGAQHPREGRTDFLPLDECVREAMTTLRARLAEVRTENVRLRKDIQMLDGQSAMMRGALEMAREWISEVKDIETVSGPDEIRGMSTGEATVHTIGEALKAEAGESLRARETWLLQEYAAVVLTEERQMDGREAAVCRNCGTFVVRPAPDQPFPTHRHKTRCPLFYLGDAAYERGPKFLRELLDQYQKRAETAEVAIQRLESGLAQILGGIPDRLVQSIGGMDNLERLRLTLAATVPKLLQVLSTAEAQTLELAAKLAVAATRAAEVLGKATADGQDVVGAEVLVPLVKKAILAAVDVDHLRVMNRLQREAQTAEDRAARARVATDEARERQERAEKRAEQVDLDSARRAASDLKQLLYYQSALEVANALLEEGIGIGATPHPLGLTHAQMLGEPPEVDQKEVYRLRKVLEVIAATGWWVNATSLGTRRVVLLAAATECETRSTRAGASESVRLALQDLGAHFATMAVEDPSADERRKLAMIAEGQK